MGYNCVECERLRNNNAPEAEGKEIAVVLVDSQGEFLERAHPKNVKHFCGNHAGSGEKTAHPNTAVQLGAAPAMPSPCTIRSVDAQGTR